MAAKDILQVGSVSLLESSDFVKNIFSENVREIVLDLIDTHRSVGGVGLAAPQIGANLRIFLTELPASPTRSQAETDNLRIYINPEITEFSNETVELYERCLSIASGDFCLPVLRPNRIIVEAYDAEGKKFRLKCDGLLARVIQHEFDHLEGILFTERTTKYREALSIEYYRRLNKTRKDLIDARKVTVKEFVYL